METQKRKPKRKSLSLFINKNCNLSCVYCYEHDKKDIFMTFEMAQSIIRKNFASCDDFDEIDISFHGGEPFLAFELMKKICEWVWCQKWPKSYIISASTNATLVHDEIKDWLVKNKHRFCACLSYDGNPYMQDLNRSGSSKDIDLDFFVKNWPEQSVKMTISDKSLVSLADGIIFLHEKGFKVSGNFAYDLKWEDENQTILVRELDKLIEFYLANPQIEPCRLLSTSLVIGATVNDKRKVCGIGTGMVAVDVDGQEYPCHRLIDEPRVTGKWENFNFYDTASLIDPNCKDCIIYAGCPTCYCSNLYQTGNFATKNKQMCKLTKICAAAASKLYAIKLVDKNSAEKIEKNKILPLITGIKKIQAAVFSKAWL